MQRHQHGHSDNKNTGSNSRSSERGKLHHFPGTQSFKEVEDGRATSTPPRMGGMLGVMEAYRVIYDSDGFQEAANRKWADHVTSLQILAGNSNVTWYELQGLRGKWVVCWRPLPDENLGG